MNDKSCFLLFPHTILRNRQLRKFEIICEKMILQYIGLTNKYKILENCFYSPLIIRNNYVQ